MRVVTCAAPTNIAVVKYWGKRDVALNTPLNASLSVTLHEDQLRATTSIASDATLQRTRLWLNGQEQPLPDRVATVLQQMQQWAERVRGAPADATRALHIASVNSFPTAAGLASSAAGYACLVAALAEFYGLSTADEEFPGQLSAIARQGSGSACRSLHGGFVAWREGCRPDGRDSIAEPVADARHWPELRALVCVVSDRRKDTSSTDGMQRTAATSQLLTYRVQHVVADRLAAMERAVAARDFAAFATLTMRDSNQFHATCLDSMPPLFYLNETSRALIRLVHRYNECAGRVQAAYTFDAGPNAVLFCEEQHVQELVALVCHCFGRSSSPVPIESSVAFDRTPAPALLERMQFPSAGGSDGAVERLPHVPDGLKRMYVSRVGGGTRVLAADEALIDAATGEPLPSRTATPRDAVGVQNFVDV
ncbi:unnamed protein product [Hyaloperonospora brassicae]|uniref:Diphosphomevalonate decarboxylase n=1 Tax=Hyaloperonospora brassicae TaxID=162125 RepID=A0AAV0UYI9_HYABA|nr:unnamed protein product [Hyaloperonospora brassicae]